MENLNILNLQKKRQSLISNFIKDNEPDFNKKHTLVFDDYFKKSYDNVIKSKDLTSKKYKFAIVALGGFGRNEMCIHSDIDILLLFEKTVPDIAKELVKEIIYPLWNTGLEIGHATRSIKDCLNLAKNDLKVLVSLIDARFICGNHELFINMNEKFSKKIIQSRSKKILTLLFNENNKRHLSYGDSSYLLEPDLKQGQGGLRDFHMIIWIAKIMSGLIQINDLMYLGYIPEKEFDVLIESVSFIHNVRNRLHHMVGRKNDHLYMEFQTKLADLMKFQKQNGQKPVEIFLGELHGRMDVIKQQYLIFQSEHSIKKHTLKIKPFNQINTNYCGFTINKHNMLEFISIEDIIKKPELLIKIFVLSCEKNIPLSAIARLIIKELLYLIDDNFISNKSIFKDFEYVLICSGSNILNEMLSTGFLVRYIPEFNGIVNRIQYNRYHIFPVDKHSIKTVQAAKSLGNKDTVDQFTAALYNDLKEKNLLLWACLLHDIGKYDIKGDHSDIGANLVDKILKRYGMEDEQIKIISYLVRKHLFLIKIATTRDIQDEETIVNCARTIKDINLLKMLYLLTISDSMATGPKAWNNWIKSLLFELFIKTINILEKGELATTEAVETVDQKKKELKLILENNKMLQKAEDCIKFMSLRYFLYVSTIDMISHINLYNKLKDSRFVWSIEKDEQSNTRIITVCAKNKPGLFSKIAGVLTLSNINILNAQIYTWKNDTAIDIFHVTPPKDLIYENEVWDTAADKLNAVLSNEIKLSVRINNKIEKEKADCSDKEKQKLQINVDNESSSFFSIVEVITNDFPGLLYIITDALFKCGLDIYISKIATKIDQVLDIFYVRNFYGEKGLTKKQQKELFDNIIEKLP